MSKLTSSLATTFTIFDLATATVQILGRDWETVPIGRWKASGSIRHRDGHHDGFTLAVSPAGELHIRNEDAEELTTLTDADPSTGLAYVAVVVADVIREELARDAITPTGPMPYETLRTSYREIERLMEQHVDRVLPRHVEGAVLDVLDEETLAEHGAPTQAVFATSEFDDGYGWSVEEVLVRFSDGSTHDVELDYGDTCRNFLADHAAAHEVGDDSKLVVSFDPPGLQITT
ncbi:hypothetical protein HHL19_35755 [Streptomyces sp. R302]|uniref:hypothetical protein n=1 Tax=unclassified Streptomyces TaxID=2593676 RepID=UPI00145C73C7|nr:MULTISPECIES: hypothetical protein [unclassified Streptomyces]NML55104.1 hypothetical protein [Streptomyces sp. R301]NML83866.1 hypothetical protein [Streptomyces sp. R302]